MVRLTGGAIFSPYKTAVAPTVSRILTAINLVTAKIGYDPNTWLHLSVSGMRTGHLSVQQDGTSALWIGNGFFRSIGSPATTRFQAYLTEGDVTAHWRSGHVSAFGGYARYSDNDPASDNGRNLFYYSVEGVQDLPKRFYAAARFSEMLAGEGYPIVGYGNFGDYFFQDLSTQLWRLSLGLGYRFSDDLIIKAEYSMEQGQLTDGEKRDHEDFLGTEAAFQFKFLWNFLAAGESYLLWHYFWVFF